MSKVKKQMTLNKKTLQEFEAHIQVDKYGDYQLCDGIRPGFGVIPKQGFKRVEYYDVNLMAPISVVMASVSKECVLDIFYEMLDLIEGEITVIIERSHFDIIKEYVCEGIDLVVLRSILVDYEDFMLNDGCFGICVFSYEGDTPLEVQFDEHKTLICYGDRGFDQILEMYGLVCNQEMKTMAEDLHLHSSSIELHSQFLELKEKIGMIEYD